MRCIVLYRGRRERGSLEAAWEPEKAEHTGTLDKLTEHRAAYMFVLELSYG